MRDLGISFFSTFASLSSHRKKGKEAAIPFCMFLIYLAVFPLSSLSVIFLLSELELLAPTRPLHKRFKINSTNCFLFSGI